MKIVAPSAVKEKTWNAKLRYRNPELGCSEDKSVDSNTNVMSERRLECPKMMHDML